MALPKTYKQAAFKEVGGPLVIEEVALKQPNKGEVLVKVEACGVCHSDIFPQYDIWGAGFPLVPGHEIIGKVVALGEGIQDWKLGDRIGGAWHGGHDGKCDTCKKGFLQFCEPYIVNGINKNGGCEYLFTSAKHYSPRILGWITLRMLHYIPQIIRPLYHPPSLSVF